MLRLSLVLVTLVGLGLAAVSQGAVQRITDFEPNEQPFDSAYTPTPWVVTENVANPSWNTAAGSNTDFTVTAGGSATGANKLEFVQDRRMMRYNPVDCYDIAGCNSFNTSDNEFWISWQTKLAAGTLGSEYQGKFTVFRGVTSVNPIGVAIAHPSVNNGNSFVLVNELAAGVNGSPAQFDTGVSNSGATEWTQIALRVGSNAEADSEIYINGQSAGLVSSLIGGASPVHSGHMNTIRFAIGNGVEGAENPTSTVFIDRVILGDNSTDVELGFMIPGENDFIWNRSGTGAWHDPLSWLPVDVPGGTDKRVTFGDAISAPSTVVVDAPVTIGDIDFTGTSSYNIAGQSSVTLSGSSPEEITRLEVFAGNHQFQAEFVLASDTVVDVAANSTLTFNNVLTLGGNSLDKIGDGTLAVNNIISSGGGTLNCLFGTCSGSGTFGGDLNNSGGTVSPGNSPGVMEVAGDYTQEADGTLLIEVGGAQAGVDHDLLAVGQTAQLDGMLQVALLDSFEPENGDVFDVLDFGEIEGTFEQVVLPALSTGLAWDASALYSEGVLTIVPEPSAAILVLLAVSVGLVRRRAR